jgi:hypothetical protein
VTVDVVPTTPLPADYAELVNTVELLEEALVDMQLAIDDQGWSRIGADPAILTADQRRLAINTARVMSVADPLISRAINLRTAYVWGQGVTIQAKQEAGADQDVNAVVQAFLDDESNKATFTSGQAHEELERRLATVGENFDVLIASPLTGRVQVRNIPAQQIDDIITNPDDDTEPWYYKRTFSSTVIDLAPQGTFTRSKQQTVYYPALGYWPRLRPSTIDGHPVAWDSVVLHTTVNRPDGSLRGVGDVWSALPWARGYKEFLEDWARLVKALSRFAFRATAKSKRGAAQVRDRMTTVPVNPDGQVGATVTTAEGQTFEAIGKSGATIDSESGRPLAAMVAAGVDLPVTMLLADPGVTGARATAETLDQPVQLIFGMRRDLHAERIQRVLGFVIDQAIKAPQGPLKGTRTVDQVTGREVFRLAGDQDRGIEVDWASLDKVDIKTFMDAIAAADGTQKVPPLVLLRLMLVAFDVDNVDEVLKQVTDANGDFIYPDDAAAARSQQAAVAAGDQPAA